MNLTSLTKISDWIQPKLRIHWRRQNRERPQQDRTNFLAKILPFNWLVSGHIRRPTVQSGRFIFPAIFIDLTFVPSFTSEWTEKKSAAQQYQYNTDAERDVNGHLSVTSHEYSVQKTKPQSFVPTVSFGGTHSGILFGSLPVLEPWAIIFHNHKAFFWWAFSFIKDYYYSYANKHGIRQLS